MPSHSPSYTKNTIRRALHAVIDPELSKKQVPEIWGYFRSECAYCGAHLVRGDRFGHIDHLIARAIGGANHISNRVLACQTCNSDKKRDSDWHSFLVAEIANKSKYDQRKEKIEKWNSMHGIPSVFDTNLIESEAAKVCQTFDDSVARIKRFSESRVLDN